jgi:hypothetical protein
MLKTITSSFIVNFLYPSIAENILNYYLFFLTLSSAFVSKLLVDRCALIPLIGITLGAWIIQAGLWLITRANGISVVWSVLAGISAVTLVRLLFQKTSCKCDRRMLVAKLAAAAGVVAFWAAFTYYVVTLGVHGAVKLTHIAHLGGYVLGAGAELTTSLLLKKHSCGHDESKTQCSNA